MPGGIMEATVIAGNSWPLCFLLASCATANANPAGVWLSRANKYCATRSSPTTLSFTLPASASFSPTSKEEMRGTITPGVSITYMEGAVPILNADRWRVTPGSGPQIAGLVPAPLPPLAGSCETVCSALMSEDFPQFGTPITISTIASFDWHSSRIHSW
eukprot:CAMPEP_0198219636 /NCGR_PEP_ID=MMETSP1445-20131203/75416_1 /TAXON_ID=36898 /ORGANISM="Pyramimonas sp., Strain CCMP2087" /LENGTH=158 /DNA_ID=CAMNT_0043897113 /DNA_START=149 /DNA_END=622 /DNA_ORIENTATION=-